jgi:hypothetical protein
MRTLETPNAYVGSQGDSGFRSILVISFEVPGLELDGSLGALPLPVCLPGLIPPALTPIRA